VSKSSKVVKEEDDDPDLQLIEGEMHTLFSRKDDITPTPTSVEKAVENVASSKKDELPRTSKNVSADDVKTNKSNAGVLSNQTSTPENTTTEVKNQIAVLQTNSSVTNSNTTTGPSGVRYSTNNTASFAGGVNYTNNTAETVGGESENRDNVLNGTALTTTNSSNHAKQNRSDIIGVDEQYNHCQNITSLSNSLSQSDCRNITAQTSEPIELQTTNKTINSYKRDVVQRNSNVLTSQDVQNSDVVTQKFRQSDDSDDEDENIDVTDDSDSIENLMVKNSIQKVRRDFIPSPYVRHSHDIRRISMASDGRDS